MNELGDKPAVACENCEWTGDESEMTKRFPCIDDLHKRVHPGEVVPAGECPKCGALAHLTHHNPVEVRPEEGVRIIFDPNAGTMQVICNHDEAKGTVVMCGGHYGAWFGVQGYGNKVDDQPLFGTIDLFPVVCGDGHPRIKLWTDIQIEDPTVDVSVIAAQEVLRKLQERPEDGKGND